MGSCFFLSLMRMNGTIGNGSILLSSLKSDSPLWMLKAIHVPKGCDLKRAGICCGGSTDATLTEKLAIYWCACKLHTVELYSRPCMTRANHMQNQKLSSCLFFFRNLCMNFGTYGVCPTMMLFRLLPGRSLTPDRTFSFNLYLLVSIMSSYCSLLLQWSSKCAAAPAFNTQMHPNWVQRLLLWKDRACFNPIHQCSEQ